MAEIQDFAIKIFFGWGDLPPPIQWLSTPPILPAMYHLPMTHLPYIIYPSSLIKVTRLPYIENITLYNEDIFSVVSIILHCFCKV